MKQWQTENTQLYFLVKDSIIISGDWETLDRETIKNRFTSGSPHRRPHVAVPRAECERDGLLETGGSREQL